MISDAIILLQSTFDPTHYICYVLPTLIELLTLINIMVDGWLFNLLCNISVAPVQQNRLI